MKATSRTRRVVFQAMMRSSKQQAEAIASGGRYDALVQKLQVYATYVRANMSVQNACVQILMYIIYVYIDSHW